MKKSFTLVLATLSTVQIGANEGANPPQSVFNYSTDISLISQIRSPNDTIIFQNGKVLRGTLGVLPKLKYSFTDINLDLDKVSVISTLSDSPDRVRVVTRNGHVYIANIDASEFPFLEQKRDKPERHMMSMREVASIMIAPREDIVPVPLKVSYLLTFSDGTVLPANIIDRTISLKEGSKEKVLQTKNILDVSFGGGLYGHILNDKGNEIDLPMTFVKNGYLTIGTPQDDKTIKLPWNKIQNIRKIGYKDDEQRLVLRIPFIQNAIGCPVKKETQSSNHYAGLAVIQPKHTGEIQKPLLAIEGVDPEKIDFDQIIAVGEDFNLEELEAPTVDLEMPTERFEFVSLGEREWGGVEDLKNLEKRRAEVAYNDINEMRRGGLDSNTSSILSSNLSTDSVSNSRSAKCPFQANSKKVTNKEYSEFVKAVGYEAPSHWGNGEYPLEIADQPVVNVSYKDAYFYTVWADKRLPTVEELTDYSDRLMDANDGYSEWTATAKLGDESIGHVVYGARTGDVVDNSSSDSKVGFRIISDR